MTAFFKQGCLHLNGESFFPIGLYSVPHAKAFPLLREAGFNLVHSYEFERSCYVNLQSTNHAFLIREGLGDEAAAEYLDEAEKHGLKVMLGFDRITQLPDEGDEISPEQEAAMTRRLLLTRDKPALLCRYTVDEPEITAKHITEKKCLHARDILRRTDPEHPAVISMFQPQKFADYAHTADVIIHDLYVFPGGNVKDVPANIVKLRQMTGGQTPIWFTVQAFDWKHYNWDGPSLVPTWEQKRCLTFLSIIAGAKGILYFSYENETHSNAPDKAPEQWAQLASLAGQLNALLPVLKQPFTEPETRLGGEIFTARAEYDGSTYLFCANSGETTLCGCVAPDIAQAHTVEVLFEERSLRPDENGLCDEFAPYAVHIYKIDRN